MQLDDLGAVHHGKGGPVNKGWQLVASTARHGDADPLIEHFIVAVFDQDHAIETLRKRKKLDADAKVLAFGPAPELTMAFLNAKRGEVYAVSVVA